MELIAIVASSCTVLAVSAPIDSQFVVVGYLQDRVHLTDELHSDRQSGFSDRATKLERHECPLLQATPFIAERSFHTLKSSGTLSSSPLGAPSRVSLVFGSA